jgi:hypothetical protein
MADAGYLKTAEKLGRVAVAAGSLGIDPTPLMDALAQTDSDCLRHCLLGIDHSFTRLSARVPWPTNDDTVEKLLAYQRRCFPEQLERAVPLLERGHRLLIQWTQGADDTLECALHSMGRKPVADDTALLVQMSGADAAVGESMSIVTHPLAGLDAAQGEGCAGVSDHWSAGASRWDFRFAVAARTPAQLGEHAAVLDSVAAGLSVTEPQRRFLSTFHPNIGRGRPVAATVSMSASAHVPRLGIEYGSISWDLAVRIFEGFRPNSAAESLGELAGATGADEAALVEIELGPEEPPALQLWAELIADKS